MLIDVRRSQKKIQDTYDRAKELGISFDMIDKWKKFNHFQEGLKGFYLTGLNFDYDLLQFTNYKIEQ